MAEKVISVTYDGRVATILIDNVKKLNALNHLQYYQLAQALREVATHDEVFITFLSAKGRFFSAGADSSIKYKKPTSGARDDTIHLEMLRSFAANNLNLAEAFYSHPKILVVGLNGPAVGLSAAFTALADFIYCTPSTYLLTPFSSLGLVVEGAASRALVQRLGIGKANEALLMSRRISAEELLHVGYVNKIFDVGREEGSDARFRALVRKEIDERLGDHLVGDSLLGIKKLIRRPELDVLEVQNVREVFAGMQRFMTGVPQEEFEKLASGKKRHKL